MPASFTLAEPLALEDLGVFVGRSARVEEGSVRLIAAGGVLAVYSAVLYPAGLLDETPTVLALRTFALQGRVSFDAVVPIRSLLERIGNVTEGTTIGVPHEVHTVTWAGISPPKGGWRGHGDLDPAALEQTARAGVEEIAEAVPEGTGAQLVQRVRSEVWSRGVPGFEHIPAGAAFAARSMGFLGEDRVQLFETGSWSRLTTTRGHVLVKRRAWTLAR